MTLREAFYKLISESPTISQRTLAKNLNLFPHAIQQRLNANKPSIDTLVLIGAELGYDVYVMPSDERKPKGAILIKETHEA